MMDSPKLIIIDVGHGNSAILIDSGGTIVFDCAPGSTLNDLLESNGISEISKVIISHADYDHIGGLIGLLLDTKVIIQEVHINPDSSKDTDSWRQLRTAVKDARVRNGTKVRTGINSDNSGEISVGEVKIEILAPSPEVALGGVEGKDLEGQKIDTNRMSVVVSLLHKGHRVALLPGDIDYNGLDNLLAEANDLSADILVFPHHGGLPGNDDTVGFASKICKAVKPKLVIFSIDRKRFSNPREEIVSTIKTALDKKVHILCTQLSIKCSSKLVQDSAHLNPVPSKGKELHKSCGGTIIVTINGDQLQYSPSVEHLDFVQRNFPVRLCI